MIGLIERHGEVRLGMSSTLGAVGRICNCLVYDAAHRRFYATGDKVVYVYQQLSPDRYQTTVVPSAPTGKTALLVPELHRYFVAVPTHADVAAQVLVFKVN